MSYAKYLSQNGGPGFFREEASGAGAKREDAHQADIQLKDLNNKVAKVAGDREAYIVASDLIRGCSTIINNVMNGEGLQHSNHVAEDVFDAAFSLR